MRYPPSSQNLSSERWKSASGDWGPAQPISALINVKGIPRFTRKLGIRRASIKLLSGDSKLHAWTTISPLEIRPKIGHQSSWSGGSKGEWGGSAEDPCSRAR